MYKHTQLGYLTIGVTLAAAVVAAWLLSLSGFMPMLWLPLGALSASALLFGSLTTEVDVTQFRFWFGLGLVHRRFPLADIESCRTVSTPWWYGWGIHWTPRGWLYNVAGREAVEISLRDGRRLRVGTDEPAELIRWITMASGRAPAEARGHSEPSAV